MFLSSYTVYKKKKTRGGEQKLDQQLVLAPLDGLPAVRAALDVHVVVAVDADPVPARVEDGVGVVLEANPALLPAILAPAPRPPALYQAIIPQIGIRPCGFIIGITASSTLPPTFSK